MPEQRLLQAFERQTAWCQQPSPFSARVLARSQAWLAGQPQALKQLSALAEDPLAGAVALRWLAALHHLALLGHEPWASLWPPTQANCSDDELDHAIAAAWSQQQAHLQAALAGPPQTNEVQRSAALLPGLLHIAARTGQPLALAEIGASAGLNLWCEQYRHEHDQANNKHAWAWGSARSGLTLRSDWSGSAPPMVPLLISQRAGCDAAPVDLTQPGEDIRLASYVWADQPERLARLRAAVTWARAQMQAQGVQIQAQQAADFVRQQLAQRPAQGAWVLMHSVVWPYIAPDQQADIAEQMALAGQAATAQAPLAWLRLEPLKADLRVELRCTIWPGGQDELLALCHPHGAWVQWQTAA